MRLRNWIAVGVSVILLLAAGAVGVFMNRAALQAANTVHLADTRALAINNATLAGQLQLLSAKELHDFVTTHPLSLRPGDRGDRKTLAGFIAKTGFFGYGVAVTDLTGSVLNTSGDRARLPKSDDPGYEPLRRLLLEGKPGFSSLMTVKGVTLEAVAVPIMVDGFPAAIMIGYIEEKKSQLQSYVAKLSTQSHLTTIVDGTGRVAAASDPALIGTTIDPTVISALGPTSAARFVEFTSAGTPMTAVVAGGLPGGWAYVRMQTDASFYGAVRSKSQTINVALLAMLLIGVVAVTALGYRSQVQRRRADERFQALFQHAPDMVSVLDDHGRIAFTSPSASAILGFPTGSLHGRSVFDIVHEDDRPQMQERFESLLGQHDGVLRLQCRVMGARGDYRWFEITASNQLHNPALTGVVVNARDVSENREFQERLAHDAEHDPLTGLPNRRRLQDALDSSLQRDAVAVLFVDLDGFKPVNDAYGHESGDHLLQQVSERLSNCVRHGDVLARVGGDEFVLLLPGVTSRRDAEATSARVREAIAEPFRIGDNDVVIGASVGVHLAAPADNPEQALRAADHAMYVVKRAGAGRRSHRAHEAPTAPAAAIR
jgi:diguanylate cyclase (GGDEF)-like protein/PAS domain S-box-containing protein